MLQFEVRFVYFYASVHAIKSCYSG